MCKDIYCPLFLADEDKEGAYGMGGHQPLRRMNLVPSGWQWGFSPADDGRGKQEADKCDYNGFIL